MPSLLWGLRAGRGLGNLAGWVEPHPRGHPPEVNTPNCPLRHKGERKIPVPFQNKSHFIDTLALPDRSLDRLLHLEGYEAQALGVPI
ncbi:16467_t:CDS:2 [Acaulospora colombiana]|uniref:16467_t:CDS:1 n=1 Tax=Acaulospora colombiana TaxID=27376 RepID=A0ACA9PAM9_9GLOM|nr:16467_t:CDS:2 [Acaulospora colombiana]